MLVSSFELKKKASKYSKIKMTINKILNITKFSYFNTDNIFELERK